MQSLIHQFPVPKYLQYDDASSWAEELEIWLERLVIETESGTTIIVNDFSETIDDIWEDVSGLHVSGGWVDNHSNDAGDAVYDGVITHVDFDTIDLSADVSSKEVLAFLKVFHSDAVPAGGIMCVRRGGETGATVDWKHEETQLQNAVRLSDYAYFIVPTNSDGEIEMHFSQANQEFQVWVIGYVDKYEE